MEKKLRERGSQGFAEILEAKESPWVVEGGSGLAADTKTVWHLKLRVRPEGQPEFDVDTTERWSQFSVPKVGSMVAVLCDPEDPRKVVVDHSRHGEGEAHALTLQQRMEADGINPEMIQQVVAQDRLSADPDAYQEQLRSKAKRLSDLGAARQADPDGLRALTERRQRGEVGDTEFDQELHRLAGGS
jgi:hypothetical protein